MSSRFARALFAPIALGAPFALLALGAGELVSPLARASAAALLRITAPLSARAATPEPEPEPEPASPAPLELSFDVATKAPRKGHAAPRRSSPAALFVSAKRVLELANGAARPQGVFVGQTEEHPAGLRLSGVDALGIGLRDGDILTEALGMTPRAAEQVIGAVIEARAKQARFLSGTLWRAGQTLRITVEQPYLQNP